MDKHTKEPWVAFIEGKTVAILDTNRKQIISWVGFDSSYFSLATQRANVRRIVACVNVCAGMKDPKKEIAALTTQRDRAIEAVEKLRGLLREEHEDFILSVTDPVICGEGRIESAWQEHKTCNPDCDVCSVLAATEPKPVEEIH